MDLHRIEADVECLDECLTWAWCGLGDVVHDFVRLVGAGDGNASLSGHFQFCLSGPNLRMIVFWMFCGWFGDEIFGEDDRHIS